MLSAWSLSGHSDVVLSAWSLSGHSDVGLPAREESAQVLGVKSGLNELVDLSTDTQLDTVLEPL